MKHGRNLTLKQKEILQTVGLNPSNWLLVKNLPDKLVILHRKKGTLTEIKLFEGEAIMA